MSELHREFEEEFEALCVAAASMSIAMMQRLCEKARLGWTGWDDFTTVDMIVERLLRAVEKGEGQEVDIANLAMMLWNFKRNGWNVRWGGVAVLNRNEVLALRNALLCSYDAACTGDDEAEKRAIASIDATDEIIEAALLKTGRHCPGGDAAEEVV